MSPRIAIGFGAAVIVAATAVVALDPRAPAPDAGDRLIETARQASGLRIEAASPAEISLFPTPRIRLRGVRVSRGAEPAFAVAREAVADLSVGALLIGRTEISDLTLDGADIALDRLPLAEGVAALKQSKGAAVALPAIQIAGGRLTWRGQEIEKVDAGLAWSRGGGPLALSGVGRFKGRSVEATAQLADVKALARYGTSPFRARIEGGGVRATFDGDALDASGAQSGGGLRLKGDIGVRAGSLGDALAWVGFSEQPKSTAWSVSLAGRGVLDGQSLDVTNAELDIAGESFLGAGRLSASADGAPALEATLDAEKIDLDRYVAALGSNFGAAGGWSAATIDLSGLKGWSLDLRVSADKVSFGEHRIGPAAATVAVAKGGLDLSLGEAAAYDGDIGGRLSLEPRGRETRMRLEAAATDVDLEEALQAMAGRTPITGTLTGDLSVEGLGASISEFVANLKGVAALRIVDGALEGVGRNRALALAGLRDRMEMSASEAHLIIDKGQAFTDDVSIVGPAAALNLGGVASLIDGELALKGVVRPARADWALPVTVEGRLSAPKLRPDLRGRAAPAGEARRGAGVSRP